MELNGQTANRVVKVGISDDGLVQLYLDSLVIEMTSANFRYFVDYLQSALHLTETLRPSTASPKLRLVQQEDNE